MNAFTRASR
jgi:hypothetical protein